MNFALPLLLFLCLLSVNGQASTWQMTNGPQGGAMEGLVFDAALDRVYGHGKGGRIFYQGNQEAAPWSEGQVIDLPSSLISKFAINVNDNTILYSIINGRLYTGSANGSWSQQAVMVDGSDQIIHEIYQGKQNTQTWFAFSQGDSPKLFISTDNMANWLSIALPAGDFSSLYQDSDQNLWLGGKDSNLDPLLYLAQNVSSTNVDWLQKGTSSIQQANTWVRSVKYINESLYVGLADGDNESFQASNDNYLFRSDDSGETFSSLHIPNTDTEVKITDGDNNHIFVVSGSYVYGSDDKGESWFDISPINNRAGDGELYISPFDASTLYLAARARGGVLISKDLGENWQSNNLGLINSSPSLLNSSKDPNKPHSLVSASLAGEGIFISDDAGISWQETSDNGLQHPWIDEVVISPHNPNEIWSIADIGTISTSLDGGNNWSTKLDTRANGFRYGSIYAMASAPSNPAIIYALKNGFGLYKSSNNGQHWQYLNDSQVDYSYSLAVHPTNSDMVLSGYNPKVAEDFSKIMRSVDGGQSWTEAKRFNASSGVTSVQFAASGTKMYAGVTSDNGGEIWLSDDSGVNWSETLGGLNFVNVRHLVQDPSNSAILYALLWGGGVYHSTDSGTNWQKLIGLQTLSDSISALLIDPNNSQTLYAGDRLSNQVFQSIDGGSSWNEYASIDGQNRIADMSITPDGNTLYVAALGFMGPFSGDTVKINLTSNIQTSISNGFDGVPLSLKAIDNNKLIAAGHGRYAYLSNDQGSNWSKLSVTPSDDENFGFFKVVSDPSNTNTLYLVGGDDRAENFTRNQVASNTMHTLWRSIDGGNNWLNLNLAHGAPLRDLAISEDGTTLVTLGMNNKIRISQDSGANWSSSDLPFSMASSVKITANKNITVGMLGGGVWAANWTASSSDLTWSGNQLNTPIKNIQIVTHPDNANTAFASAYPGGVYGTTDGGNSWLELNDGLPTVNVTDANRQGYYRLAIDNSNGNRLLLGLYGKGLFTTAQTDDIIWQPINGASHELSGIKITDILIDEEQWWLASEDGIWTSSNQGENWLQQNNNIDVPDVRTLAMGQNNQLLAGTRGYEIYINHTDDGWTQLPSFGNFGVRWSQWNRNLYQYSTLLFDQSDENTVYIGTFPAGMYKSQDKGLTWREHNVGWGNDGVFSLVQPLKDKPEVILAGTYNGINISEDAGQTWQASDTGMPQEQWVFSIALDPFDSSGQTLYAASKNGLNLGAGDDDNEIFGTVMKSNDGGKNWQEITNGLSKDQEFYRIISDPNKQNRFYLATQWSGVWKTEDGGANWSNWSEGLPTDLAAATNGNNVAATMDISEDGQYLYFGSNGMGIWRRATASHVDSIQLHSKKTSLDFGLITQQEINTQSLSFNLSNVGDLNFSLSNLSIDQQGDVFVLDKSLCGSQLIPLQSCLINITIKENSVGEFTGTISLETLADETLANDITVSVNINHPPIANDQQLEVNEDTQLNIMADISDNNNSDILELSISQTTQHGTLQINNEGNGFSYQPSKDYFGNDSFSYEVSDSLNSDTATVDIVVTSINDAPTFTNPVLSVMVGETLSYQLIAQDVENQELEFTLIEPDSDANDTSATLSELGAFTFSSITPGDHTLNIAITDGFDSLTVTLLINVTAQPVEPEEPSASTGGGGALSFMIFLIFGLMQFRFKSAKPHLKRT